jgi:hypothetical protein
MTADRSCTGGKHWTAWLHGDLKDIAYFFNHSIFTDVVNKGDLK